MKTLNIETIDLSDRFGVDKLRPYLPWWVEQTQNEKHMFPVTEESLLAELRAAAIILDENNKIIGAAGLVDARGKEKTEIIYNGQKVVELGSYVIHTDHRNQGIGTTLLRKQLEISKEKNWFPVSISSNPAMQKVFKKADGSPMDDKEHFATLRQQLCLCDTVHDGCNLCPLKKEGGWVFPH